ncbi:MAG: Holliday junction branch migration protein RuvA [Gammaproteobacteria bacterium]|nr:Holliday junction branch migration protein RuvA [Gammaproteobacteria bacterium]
MIGFLRGRIASKQPPQLVIDVNGVGYEVDAPMSTFYELPEVGEETFLHTHLVVREDAQLLYGFISEGERRLFRELIKVSGVGAKVAINILSGSSVEQFARAVNEGDAAALTRLPGIGKKTAERLLVEMRDRLKKEPITGVSAVGGALPSQSASPADEAWDALVALGYKPAEATKMISKVETDGLASEVIIRQALQSTVK